MKKAFNLFLLFSFVINYQLFSQPFGDQLSMKVEATVQSSPPKIELNWPLDANASEYIVYRKLKNSTSWGSPIANLSGTEIGYEDNTVETNILYDYRVQMNSATSPTKHGYLSSGIQVKMNSNNGIAILVVESSHLSNTAFQNALNIYIEDIELNGWFPKILYVNASDNVSSVKSEIVNIYNQNPSQTKLLSLIGNVPVPYSGNLNPDGHTDHQGAWPTDTYYADINGNWTDASVNNISSANSNNHNIPGDGKFDQSYIASDVELQVGRIDLSNLPTFSLNETDLLTKYLMKNHLYKTGELVVEEKSLIDDNFTGMAEGFSQNGYNNFANLVGRGNTYLIDYFTNLSYNTSATGTYLWSYGCGAGTYTNCSGVGNSNAFSNDTLSTIFTMLFGSYFGDWNYTNSLLRAPLAQGNTLTNCWAGRPNWYFSHMGMGENIGYSTRLTQNNGGLYQASTLGGLSRMVTINLMGDPSLKMTYIPAPNNLVINEFGNSNELNWTASTGSEIGYNIYRRYSDSVDFVKLNNSLVTGNSFVDNTLPVSGTVYYYVKAVEMKTTPSGSFENESLAIKGEAFSSVNIIENNVDLIKIYPTPTIDLLNVEIDDSFIGMTYNIIDNRGKIVSHGILNNIKLNIDLSHLPSGIYQIIIEENQINKTIIKI